MKRAMLPLFKHATKPVAKLAAKLVAILILVSVGVNIWYSRIEEQFLADSGKPPLLAKKLATKLAAKKIVTTAAVDEKSAQPAPGTATAEQERKVVPPVQDFQVIIQRNIFQAALDKIEEPEPVEQVQVAAPTALNLTLLGTVSGNKHTARAIIVDNTKKKQELFQIGDAVQGAFIETIERGRVTLEHNGILEALTMKEREGGGPGPPKLPRSITHPAPEKMPDVESSDRKITNKRKAPVRPHRRVSFRRDPAAEQERDESEEMPMDGGPPPDEELLPALE